MAQTNPKIGDSSFNELKDLAQTDPSKFEAKRKELIDSCINQQPEVKRLRLRQFQFRIDGIRWRYRKNALLCTQYIFGEMLSSQLKTAERFTELAVLLKKLQSDMKTR